MYAALRLEPFAFLNCSGFARTARKRLSPTGRSALPSLKSRFAFRFRFSTSASVRDDRPSSAFGRSSGVALLFNQTPCRSGCPSWVRGGFHDVALGVCHTVLVALDVCDAGRATIAPRSTVPARTECRMSLPLCFLRLPWSVKRTDDIAARSKLHSERQRR